VQVGLLPRAVDKKSLIVNDVDEELTLMTDENALAFVVGCLISNAVCSSSDNCIHVGSISGKNSTQVIVKHNGTFTYSREMYSLVIITEAVRKLGGSLCLQKEPNKGFLVTLSIAIPD
jgi:hypothetical protein